MTKMEKMDNILIAEFMGFEPKRFSREGEVIWCNPRPVGELQFDTSWDWLMPVVEKIEGLGFSVNIVSVWCDVERKTKRVELIVESEADTKIQATYKSVVEFIKWYNSQNNFKEGREKE